MNAKSVLYFLFIICLVILMVAEACQDSPTIYTGSIYYGYGDIAHTDISGSPKVSLCDITPPWAGTPIVDELLTEDIPETYSNGTERYVVTMFDGFIGEETKSAKFRECWYTEDGNRYVKTSGSNSLLGNSWANAWLTMGYGFQNIPSGKDLYVEEGLYGGETLSNLDPPQTMQMYIQPSGHTETACNVWLNSTDVFDVNSFSWVSVNPFSSYDMTMIQTGVTVTHNGLISAFDINSNVSGSIKLKIFRDDGTNFIFIGEGEYEPIGSGYNYFVNAGGIQAQSGDLFGFVGSSVPTFAIMREPTVGYNVYRHSGDVTSTTLKSSWSQYTDKRYHITLRCFKST